MLQDILTYYNRYSPVGDITVIGTCLCFLILISLSYIKKSRAFNIYRSIIYIILFATICRLGYYQSLNMLKEGVDIPFIYVKLLRFGFYALIFSTLFLFVIYMVEPLHIEHWVATRHVAVISIFYFINGCKVTTFLPKSVKI